MSDPFSIAAGVVSIVVPALHGTRLLLGDLQQLKDAPKTVKRLTDNVQSVDKALKLLEGVERRELGLLGAGIAENAQVAIKACTEACELFRADLEGWTKHSEDGKLVWRDRAKIGFWKKGQIAAMSEQLSNCKLTINAVVGTATLYSSVRNSHLTEEIRSMILIRQSEVQGAITTTDQRLGTVETRLQELNLSSDDDDEDGESSNQLNDKANVLRQLQAELNAVKASQALLSELLAKTREEAVANAAMNREGPITVTFGTNNSGFQAGVFHGQGGTINLGRN